MISKTTHYDAIILGAGASGLMAAITSAKRGRKVLVIDHSKIIGHKILVSGGGKCNVTNMHISNKDYFGEDTNFCKFALKGFTTKSILQILQQADIQTEERDYGRVFCKQNAKELVSYLTLSAKDFGVDFLLEATVEKLVFNEELFHISCNNHIYISSHLLIATGSLAWPQIGATDFGHKLAKQFGHKIIPVKPALTGFILPQNSQLLNLQGISLDVEVQIVGKSNLIAEPLLFTHKGLSGPSMLQVSCFWEKEDVIEINFLPEEDASALMHDPLNGKLLVKNLFTRFLPERLIQSIFPSELLTRKVAELGKKDRNTIIGSIHKYPAKPSSLEGFSKAEAALGGVSTENINPKTMESLISPKLFFSGEVIDVTGKLGGYNIHWAFASGYAAGQSL